MTGEPHIKPKGAEMADKKEVRGGKPFDLSNLDTSAAAEMGAVLDVLHPTENLPIGVRITLAGADSDIYQKFVNKAANKVRQRIKPGRPYTPPSQEEENERGIALLVACTLGWEGMIMNGKEYPFTPENARVLYANPGYTWLRTQVDEFIGDRSNFLSK